MQSQGRTQMLYYKTKKNPTPNPQIIPPLKETLPQADHLQLVDNVRKQSRFYFCYIQPDKQCFLAESASCSRAQMFPAFKQFWIHFYGHSLCLDKEGHSTPKYSVKWINIYSDRQMEKALFWQSSCRKISTSVLLNSCHFCRNQGICPRQFEQILLFFLNLFKQRNWFLRYLGRQDLTKSCQDGKSGGTPHLIGKDI